MEKKTIYILLKLLLSLFFLTNVASLAWSQVRFPLVKPQKEKITINSENLHFEKVFPIYSKRGEKVYELAMTSVSFDKQTVGLLQFQLNIVGKDANTGEQEYEPNILNPDRWGHGEGNWIFKPEELCSANRGNRSNGANRIFLMRRMKISIMITNIEHNYDFTGIKQMIVIISVEPSGSNRNRPISEVSKTLKPCQ